MAELIPRTIKTKTGLEVLLRSPRADEAAEFLAAMKEIMAQSPYVLSEPDEFNPTVEEQAKLLASYAVHPDRLWIAPMIDGKFAGGMDFRAGSKRLNSHHGSLGISIASSLRGQGVGRAVMEALIEWAYENPRIETLRLQVFPRNLAAMNLYRSLGFVEEGRELRAIKFADGTYEDLVSMAKDVRIGLA